MCDRCFSVIFLVFVCVSNEFKRVLKKMNLTAHSGKNTKFENKYVLTPHTQEIFICFARLRKLN